MSARTKWFPGMLDTRGMRVLVVDDRGYPCEWAAIPSEGARYRVASGYGAPGWCENLWHDAKPDLTDYATAAIATARGAP